MANFKPSRWIPWAIVGAGLPYLAAGWLNTSSLTGDISKRATDALSANPLTAWATVKTDGRDIVLAGTAPGKDAIDAAVKAVAETYGVRSVSASGVQIVEPPKLMAPTVESVNATTATPEIKGTWQEGIAKTLSVAVGGTTYTLGQSPELTSQAGNWLLKLAAPLAEGSYDVTAEVSDGGSVKLASAAPGKLVIDLPDAAPAASTEATAAAQQALATAPAVEAKVEIAAPAAGAVWPYPISGTFTGKSLTAAIEGRTYELNRGAALTDDGKGTFTFAPAAKFAPGAHDVVFTADNGAGATSKATVQIVVPEPKVAAPAPTAAAASSESSATVSATVVPEAKVEIAPPASGAVWPYAITGSFSGKSLTAAIDGRTYELDRGAALTSDGKGGFTFAPVAKFAPGPHDVDFTADNGSGGVSKTTVQIVVPEPKPAAVVATPAPDLNAPTVDAKVSNLGAVVVKGTWPEATAKSLSVTLDGKTYEYGKDANLQSRNGAWSLLPSVALKDGIYDVGVSVTGADGKVIKDTTANELQISSGEPPQAQPAYDCAAVLARIHMVFPVRFGFDHDDLKSPYDIALNNYISLLKDPRCLSLKVEVAGHADDRGSEKYNQGLSERRANTVLKALEAAGIEASRLTVKGYSENKPVDTTGTEEGRAKNRRVEFTALQ